MSQVGVLCSYAWPGSARQLKNVVERAAVMCAGSLVTLDDLPDTLLRPSEPIRLLRFVLLLFLFTGCASAFVSSAPVVPLHSKRNDVSASAVVRPIFPGLGVHANAAWSPTDEVVITTSGTLTHYKDDTEQATLSPPGERSPAAEEASRHAVRTHSRSLQAELGAGRSFAWRVHRVELLGGGGGGTVDVADDQSLNEPWEYWIESKGSFTRGYAQAHYGVQWRVVELAAGARVSLTRYQIDEDFGQPTDRLAWIPAVEPFATVRAGTGWLKGQAMLVVPTSFNTKSMRAGEGDTIDPAQAPYVVLGLHVNTADLWRGRSRAKRSLP